MCIQLKHHININFKIRILPQELELAALDMASYWDVFVDPQKEWKLDHFGALHAARGSDVLPYPINLKKNQKYSNSIM